MAFTLSNLLVAVLQEIGQLKTTVATGGTTLTAIDTKQIGKSSGGAWKDGTLIVINDAGGAGAAPEGEFNRISAYVDTTGVFTVDTAFTVSVASGDTFGWASQFYPLHDVIEAINAGFRKLGDIALVDTTTLDTASGKTEYAASVAWKRREPGKIDYQGQTGDSDDNECIRLHNWEFVPAAPGSSGLIVFQEQLISGRDIRVWYVDQHPRLNDFDDVVSETVTPKLAVAAAVESTLNWQNSRLRGNNDFLIQRLNDAKIELSRRMTEVPIWKPKRSGKLMIVGESRRRYPGDPEILSRRRW